MKEDYQKALKKLSLFFLSNPVPFNGQSYQKQKESGTSHQSFLRPRNKFRKFQISNKKCNCIRTKLPIQANASTLKKPYK